MGSVIEAWRSFGIDGEQDQSSTQSFGLYGEGCGLPADGCQRKGGWQRKGGCEGAVMGHVGGDPSVESVCSWGRRGESRTEEERSSSRG